MVKWRNPLSEEEMKEWESISIKSDSGALIKGLFAKSRREEQKATIVLGHPMGKEAKGYFLKRGYTELSRDQGYNVVVFDINGFGESSMGNFSYFEDIVAISIKAKELTPNLPIGYHGISLGAQYSVIAFTDDKHQYNFAIVESAATTLKEFWVRFPVAYRALLFISMFLPKYERKIEMIERMKEVKKIDSMLLIYSKGDTWVPFEMGERYQKNAPLKAGLWEVEKAEHAAIMESSQKKEYQAKIIEFFDLSVVEGKGYRKPEH